MGAGGAARGGEDVPSPPRCRYLPETMKTFYMNAWVYLSTNERGWVSGPARDRYEITSGERCKSSGSSTRRAALF